MLSNRLLVADESDATLVSILERLPSATLASNLSLRNMAEAGQMQHGFTQYPLKYTS